MLVIYQVTEDIYQCDCGFYEFGILNILDELTKDESITACKIHFKCIVNSVIISNELDF